MSEKITENELIVQRRAKLDNIRSRGNAYPVGYRRDLMAKDLHERYDGLDN